MPTSKSAETQLSAAREAYARQAWGEAYERLTAADRNAVLDAHDLERLAITAYLTGRPDASDEIGARAHLAAIREGDLELSIRARSGGCPHGAQRVGAGGLLLRGAIVEDGGAKASESGRVSSGRPTSTDVRRCDGARLRAGLATADRFGDPELATMGRLGRGWH
jgi:hypothetical protein